MDPTLLMMSNTGEDDNERTDARTLAEGVTLWGVDRDAQWSSESGSGRDSADDASGLELFRTVIRQVPLLTSEQEVTLGRDLHESRLLMTAVLCRVPAAVEIFLAALEEAIAGDAPLINVL
ncbi:MAG: hypothetical protein GWN84_16790, partial [Gammaproteobacteria bacterium]|nr:hypothetical protein [Gammaproteobacteria bacterium]NIR84495.1 hypothetical protein [Gammaproteobacteria bacterium]NIR90398.1 hypothetical protein [Gammaproteobacteria bacterium]NIU05546.1 hypothetical protein [Gammaproteobacteria bacterium]NIV52685.1 hypothetical protein [Gammaproteobacteria bacterium]